MTNHDGITVEQVYIKIDGSYVNQAVMDDLAMVEVDLSFDMPDMCVVSIRDDKLEWMKAGLFDIGAEIEIEYALDQNKASVMKGEITSLEPIYGDDYSAMLVVRGYDKRHRMNRGTKSQAWQKVTDTDLAQKIASGAGLTLTGDTVSGGIHEHIFQGNTTDMAFLQQLARSNGFELFFKGGQVQFKKAKSSGAAKVAMEWGDALQRFRPRASVAGQVNEVNVRGWDPKQKQAIIGKATSSSVEPKIGMGGSGGTVAKKAFGNAVQVEVRRPVATQKQADALAQAILDEVNGGFIEAEGLCDGSPNILPGVTVSLTNLGSKFNGDYLVTSVRHVYAERYYTEFTATGTRPRLVSEMIAGASVSAAQIDRWAGVVSAIVTNVNDPDDMGRVKLKYPWLDDNLESGWARVAMMGGGASRGFNFLPEVNDEVLVAFEQGDFNYPYVLGGLYNGKDKVPDPKKHAQNGKIEQRTLRTRAGHLIRFTDKGGEEKIEIIDGKDQTKIVMDQANKQITITSTGKVVVNTDAETEVNAKKDVTVDSKANVKVTATGNANIEAKGNATVKATASMTIEAGGSMTLKAASISIEATGAFTLKGNAPSTVQSSAILNLKGSLVNVN